MKPLLPPIFGLLLIIVFAACQNDLAELKRIELTEQAGVETAKNVEILYSDSAVIRVRIKAPVMLNILDQRDPHREFPKGVKVDFFNAAKEPTSYLTARHALHYEAKHKVILQDSVVVWNTAHQSIQSDELIWDDAKGQIYSDKFVTIRKPDREVIYGYGFRSNVDFTDWRLDSVSGIVRANNFADDAVFQ